jgi:hypothetical protein
MIDRSCSRLGDLLVKLATEQCASDPRVIAKHIEEATGHKVSHREISAYIYGTGFPGPKFMRAFSEAFSLTVEEGRKLAWIYTFSKLPDEGPSDER